MPADKYRGFRKYFGSQIERRFAKGHGKTKLPPIREEALRLTICTFLTCLIATHAAMAQSCPPPPPASGQPILHLDETASANAQPSLLVADLVANAEALIAVTAQRRVNNLMAQASGLAGNVAS